jgi:hypothetical protein
LVFCFCSSRNCCALAASWPSSSRRKLLSHAKVSRAIESPVRVIRRTPASRRQRKACGRVYTWYRHCAMEKRRRRRSEEEGGVGGNVRET